MNFTPHGYCLHWEHSLLWTIVSSDLIISLSYFSIPFAIWHFANARPDISNRWLFHLFGLFIVACGFTHLFDMVTIWYPNYWLSAGAKIVTAILSIITAVALWVYMPKFIAMPSALQLSQAKDSLSQANEMLEQRVQKRTSELERVNAQLSESLELSRKYELAKQTIHTMANFDPLTGLSNKRAFTDWFNERVLNINNDGRSYLTLCFDINSLKKINNAMGYKAGDKIIVRVSEMLKELLGSEDFLCRLDGDSFILHIDNSFESFDEAELLAIEIHDALHRKTSKPFFIQGSLVDFSVSIGAMVYKEVNFTCEEMIRYTTIASREAKSLGLNRPIFFHDDLQTSLSENLSLEISLKQAVPDELSLVYQAQYDTDGTVIGAEALLRWNSRTHGQVSPALFIPIAEQTGMIRPIGKWVIEEACRQLKSWKTDPKKQHIKIAVNISPKEFMDDSFVDRLQHAIEVNQIDTHLLELELTETALMENLELVAAKMNTLRKLGLRFALDDFGTGFSSLTYLKNLPIDKLKIDKSFVMDLETDSNDASIVRSIIAMGNSLGIEVIAEGVETAFEKDFLEINGCRYYQGYFFARPVPPEELDLG